MTPRFVASDMRLPWHHRNGWGDYKRTSLGREAGEIYFRQMCMVREHLNGTALCWTHGVKGRAELRASCVPLGSA